MRASGGSCGNWPCRGRGGMEFGMFSLDFGVWGSGCSARVDGLLVGGDEVWTTFFHGL